MIDAATVIELARNHSPAFDPQNHPSGLVLQHLSVYAVTLTSKALLSDEHFNSTTEDVAFPLDDITEGVALPEFQRWHGGTVFFEKSWMDPAPLVKMAWENRTRPLFRYTAYLDGRKVYFAGAADNWNDVERVALSYTPTPVTVDGIEVAGFNLPDSALPVLVDEAVLFMAGRNPTPVKVRVEPGASELLWLEEIRRNRVPARITRYLKRR